MGRLRGQVGLACGAWQAINGVFITHTCPRAAVKRRVGPGSRKRGRTSRLRVASFFSGIGGFDLGFERAGMEVVFQSEINPFCRRVLKKHWPAVTLAGDINHLEIGDIPRGADVWCGGFPCQDVSLANQGKRRGLEGDRSGLFFAFASLVKGHLPPYVVLENVPGLLNSRAGADFQTVLRTLGKLGYVCAWRVLDAKYFGTPQRRRRVIVVASLGNESAAEVLLDPGTVEALPEEDADEKRRLARQRDGLDKEPDCVSIQHGCIGRKPGAGPAAKGWRADGETWTLDSRGSADVVCSAHAPFRVREASGVPEGLDANRYRAIGNAVPVMVAEWVGKRLVRVASKGRELSF